MTCFKPRHDVTGTTAVMSWNTELGRRANSWLAWAGANAPPLASLSRCCVSGSKSLLGMPSLAEHKTLAALSLERRKMQISPIKINLEASHFQDWLTSLLISIFLEPGFFHLSTLPSLGAGLAPITTIPGCLCSRYLTQPWHYPISRRKRAVSYYVSFYQKGN